MLNLNPKGEFVISESSVKKQHRDTLFRGYFKIPENFLYLLERCRTGENAQPLTVADITPFDLESEITIRLWRNDVSFITKDNKLGRVPTIKI